MKSNRQPAPRPPHRDAEELRVVLVPVPPEEIEAAWQRWVETVDWLVSVGAQDA